MCEQENSHCTCDTAAIDNESVSQNMIEWVDSIVSARDKLAMEACSKANMREPEFVMLSRKSINDLYEALNGDKREFTSYSSKDWASITYKNIRFVYYEVV